jgi:hypothetical protein
LRYWWRVSTLYISKNRTHEPPVYHYRATLIPHLPSRVRSLFPGLSNYTPLSTFSDQVNAGMTSSDFDIEANVRDGDSRAGLDERGTQEVMEIMRRERVK